MTPQESDHSAASFASWQQISRRRLLKTLFCSSAMLGSKSVSQAIEVAASSTAQEQHFLIIGDWGRGSDDQRQVATAMQQYVTQQKITPAGVWMLGDNFYGEVEKGVSSPRWKTDFEDMYPAASFPGPCWAVLGNHDYHDTVNGELIQLNYHRANPQTRWTMPAKWYVVEWPREKPLIRFIAVDSNWRDINLPLHIGSLVSREAWWLTDEEQERQQQWLNAELAKSTAAPFVCVMGHHPLYSNGPHGDTEELVKAWGPLFEKHGVAAYFCGHDHDLQHLEIDGLKTSFVVSGAGGAPLTPLSDTHPAAFAQNAFGFTHLQVNRERLLVRHIDATGRQCHAFSRDRAGKVKTL